MKYLKLYKKCIKLGRVADQNKKAGPNGLCNIPGMGKAMEIFSPTFTDREALEAEGKNHAFWGSDLPLYQDGKTPTPVDMLASHLSGLRLNMILLLAALNGEL